LTLSVWWQKGRPAYAKRVPVVARSSVLEQLDEETAGKWLAQVHLEERC